MHLVRTLTAGAGLLAVTVLAGCADTTPADRVGLVGQRVTRVYAYDGLFTEPFGEIAERLHDETGLTVDLQLAGNSYDDSLARLRNDLTAGNPPDITMAGLNQVRMLVEADAAVPLGSFIEDDDEFDLGQYTDGMLETTTFDGELYGMPNAVSTLIMYYNAELFEEAGLDPEAPPQTWSEIEQAAQAIVDSGAATYGHWSDFESIWAFENFMRSNGGEMMDAGEETVTFNQSAGVEVLEFWRGMVEDELMPPFGTDDGREAFFRGDVAMAIDSSAQVGNYERTAGFDLRTAMLPIPDDGSRQAPGAGNALVITADDPERQQLAWEALKAFVGPEGSTTTTMATGYIPVNAFAADSDEHLAGFLADTPTRHAVLEQGRSLVRWFSWPGERGPEIGKELQNAIYRAVTGEEEAQQALDTAAAAAERLLP